MGDENPRALPELFRAVAPDYREPDPYDAPGLRWGIIGPGGIARKFAGEVPAHSNQSVIAVGSRDASRAVQFASGFGIDPAKAYGSYEDLVADPDVDAVYIATPHNYHKEQALLALRAGKPVLVEKPFMVSAAEAEEVFEEAEARGLFAMEAMWSRHLPHYEWIRKVLKSGALGPLRYFSADHGQSLLHIPRLVQPELAGGAMLDLGVYPLHLQQMVLGKPDALKSFSRMATNLVDVGDVVISDYPEASAMISCVMDTVTPTGGILSFEKGRITIPENFYGPTVVSLDVHQLDTLDARILGTESAIWDARFPGGFQYQAADAARCIVAGQTQSSVVPWDATLEVQRMMDEVLESAGYLDRTG